MQYHVNAETGEPGECHADVRSCPVAGDDLHHGSRAEAQAHGQRILGERYGTTATLRRSPAPGAITQRLNPDRRPTEPRVITLGSVEVNEDFPHPQADNLDKVSSTVDAVAAGANTAEGLSIALDVVGRQGYYYGDAAGYLGLVQVSESGGLKEYELTERGEQFAQADADERAAILRETITGMPLMQTYLQDGDEGALDYIRDSQDVNDTTAQRRLSTLKGWSQTVADEHFSQAIESDRTSGAARLFDASAHAQEQRRAREARVTVKEPLRGAVCPRCFTVMSLTGACDNCD